MKNTRDIGNAGEEQAILFLKQEGYTILEKNYRSKWAEIDIIALTEDILTFVEVKSRKNANYGLPCEAVNGKKQEKIMSLASLYQQKCKVNFEEIRFDIIEIYQEEGKIRHIINAF